MDFQRFYVFEMELNEELISYCFRDKTETLSDKQNITKF